MRIPITLFYLLCSIATASTQSSIQDKINQTAQAANLQQGQLGVMLMEVQSGKVLASYNADKSLIPASTIKAITTASALKLLGASYQFKTELQYDGAIENGVLKGNLYIKGYGDPTLGSEEMEEAIGMEALLEICLQATQKAGIRAVEGAVVGDASYFKGNVAGRNWQWADLGNYYASGIWGLNLHENLYRLSFEQTSRLGATPKVAKIEPKIPSISFINELKSAGRNTGDNAYIYGGPYADTRFIRGTIPVGSGLFTIKGSIPNPPLFAAHQLRRKLIASGIHVEQDANTNLKINPKRSRQIIYTHYSPELLEIAKRANFRSVNLYCEAMIRAIGAKANADDSLEGGIEAIENYWASEGVDMRGFFLQDGSGLSARNGATPNQFACILQQISRDQSLFDVFYNTLPVGGQSGTLKSLFRNTAVVGKIRAKSGSISRVRAYTGYAKNKKGQLLAFAVIANNYTGSSRTVRKQLETLMIQFCE
ncbi:MAG: D-alanyl-D-alanine carboxypeptidase/D-alanyl-D-alanine-endopeptidase [Bacteroidota bacterium]